MSVWSSRHQQIPSSSSMRTTSLHLDFKRGLLCTNESNLILVLHAILLRCLIQLFFQVVILFLLLRLLIHHLFWDTGLGVRAIMYIKVLWKLKGSSDAYNETVIICGYYYYGYYDYESWYQNRKPLLVLLWVDWHWEGGSSPMMLCFILPWEISFWNIMIML